MLTAITAPLSEHIMISRRHLLIASTIVGTMIAYPVLAQQSKPPVNLDKENLAIKGYDPVAYFTLAAPTKGKPEINMAHEGATYRFATAEHKAAFEKEPAKYLPAYGGYCAFAAAKGALAPVDPTIWAVVDGKLYLNFNAKVGQTWSAEKADFIKTANANWIDWQKLKKN